MRSLLLLKSQPLVVIKELADIIGLNEAIILQQVHYWTELNRQARRNYHEGYCWTYNSIEAWHDQFSFWSVDTIRRAIGTLEGRGLLISGNYNKMKMDRTKWYRVNYNELEKLTDNIRYLNGGDPTTAQDSQEALAESFWQVNKTMEAREIEQLRQSEA